MARTTTPLSSPVAVPHHHDLELLAPARDADIGIEAVNHGADAVYIGGPSFGARAAASNEVADIERLVKHAHRYGSRVFVTLNTILRDDELEPARRVIQQIHEAGADALIVQDMGLLELARSGALAPIQLHASTQCDIRSPEKARFLQDAGLAQLVLARELTLAQIRAVAAEVQRAKLEFFIHGALCVAYSGQCYVSHAQTGRSANRGDCSQACRLPYTVTDDQGRIVAHEQHVLSMKDNNQSANLAALVDAGIRSFKIEGRYKDLGYVKNITAHYRILLDELLEQRPELAAASSGLCTFSFQPDPERNFNRGSTDYFVTGRKDDIGAFDTPKHAGLPLGYCQKLNKDGSFDVELDEGVAPMSNGDCLTWYSLQRELQGVRAETVSSLDGAKGGKGRRWRVVPNSATAFSAGQAEAAKARAKEGKDGHKDAAADAKRKPAAQLDATPSDALKQPLKDLRAGTVLGRNREMAWDHMLARKSAERRIAVDLFWQETATGFKLDAVDADGHFTSVEAPAAHEDARDPERAAAQLREHLGKLGNTIFEARSVDLGNAGGRFVPASLANSLRRELIEQLEATRLAALPRLTPHAPAEPPAPYPEDTLTYLANVYNRRAHDFYAHHGVKVIEAAYESHQELGEASLMITKHCVRFSLSLCPKQAKGVTGVQGTIRAEPLTIQHGKDTLTLRFDCKPCEMHVVGRIRSAVLQAPRLSEHGVPVQFYKHRPTAVGKASAQPQPTDA
jgi:putative protease